MPVAKKQLLMTAQAGRDVPLKSPSSIGENASSSRSAIRVPTITKRELFTGIAACRRAGQKDGSRYIRLAINGRPGGAGEKLEHRHYERAKTRQHGSAFR